MTTEMTAASTTITLEDGRVFPVFDGQPLAWDTGLYHTFAEQQAGFPRMKAVIAAMREHRPEQLEQERRGLMKAQFDRMFGHNARVALDVIEGRR